MPVVGVGGSTVPPPSVRYCDITKPLFPLYVVLDQVLLWVCTVNAVPLGIWTGLGAEVLARAAEMVDGVDVIDIQRTKIDDLHRVTPVFHV